MKALLTICALLATLTVSTKAMVAAQRADSVLNILGADFVRGVNDTTRVERLAAVNNIYDASLIEELGNERLLGLFERIHSDFGELTYHHSESTGNHLHIFAQSLKDKQWHDFQFGLTSGAEPKLLKIVFIADVTEPIYLPNGRIEDPFTLRWLDSYVDKLVKENDLASAILIARGDSVVYERYTGFADVARTRRIGPSTRLNLGSGNKMFTALAIMQLRDAGKLKLTDTLSRYFPDYPHQQFVRSATVHHLLFSYGRARRLLD